MNAATRTARRTIAARSTQTRAAARITRNGAASLTTYGISAGLSVKAARSVAGSLRKAATKLQITGQAVRVHASGRMRDARHYTPTEVALAAAIYAPRKLAYRTARLALCT